MATAKHVRRSITLPREVAKRVEAISKQRRLSDNRVLVELIEQGIQAQKEKEKAFSIWRNAFARRVIPRKSISWGVSCSVNNAPDRELVEKCPPPFGNISSSACTTATSGSMT